MNKSSGDVYKQGNTAARGFKEFVLRGNVVDLAVGIVVGASFSGLINSFVSSFVTPVISLVGGQQDLSGLSFSINGVVFETGTFLNAFIAFVIVALILYYFVVLPMNRLTEITRVGKSPDPTEKKCDFCFTDIPVKASRCPNCTSEFEKADS